MTSVIRFTNKWLLQFLLVNQDKVRQEYSNFPQKNIFELIILKNIAKIKYVENITLNYLEH